MNKDEGAYKLDRIYNQFIEKRQSRSLVTSSKPNTGVAKIYKHLRQQSEQGSWQELEIFWVSTNKCSWIWSEDSQINDINEQSWWIYLKKWNTKFNSFIFCISTGPYGVRST